MSKDRGRGPSELKLRLPLRARLNLGSFVSTFGGQGLSHQLQSTLKSLAYQVSLSKTFFFLIQQQALGQRRPLATLKETRLIPVEVAVCRYGLATQSGSTENAMLCVNQKKLPILSKNWVHCLKTTGLFRLDLHCQRLCKCVVKAEIRWWQPCHTDTG